MCKVDGLMTLLVCVGVPEALDAATTTCLLRAVKVEQLGP
jgi:hypothetical protein